MSWLSAFRAVPWVQVIAATPVVVRGARRLWAGIREGRAGPPGTTADRLRALEDQVAALHKDLAASNEVIKSLAEQHARLVEVAGILRIRVRALFATTLVLAVAWAATALWLATR